MSPIYQADAARKDPPLWPALLQILPQPLRRMPRPVAVALVAALVTAVFFVEYLSGPHVSAPILSFVPITVAVLCLGGAWNVIAPALSAGGWLWAEFLAGQIYPHMGMGIWNALIRFGLFMAYVTLLMMAQRYMQEREAPRRRCGSRL
ncbi:MAG: hypothetical protein NTY77_16640 [Elusimicrobia bacterium]|nr:hypothetical protein [Elusimicrobiota bacterium]